MALIGPVFALWPVGLVMGGPARSLGRAVQAMRGAYLGFVLAMLLLCVLPTALATGLTFIQVGADLMPTPPLILASAAISAAMKFVGFLLAAEVFRRRYLTAQDVSGVFD